MLPKKINSEARKTTRWIGLIGLEGLYEYPKAVVLKLKTDKSEKVREKAEEMLKHGTKREFPVWMFDKKNVERTTSETITILKNNDRTN